MVKNLQAVHRNGAGREVRVSAERAGGVRLLVCEPIWVPLHHPSERSIVTYWWSATTGKHVGCRSLQRLSEAMLLDFHPDVSDFAAWTARLDWSERGKTRRFVPGFFVRTADGTTVVVACPPVSGSSDRWKRPQDVLRENLDTTIFGGPARLPRLRRAG
ncbi:hypothetical protein POF50_032355 [Streptomyces sp. SL13]|uniref:Uncharacterized protein n=1 Tax=Streptantibioticus silvisoli TaxID=2705255 RepID=A0AA90H4I9_9ACTN|nr:hypothetical protein [Streptantibioticus silvisoli]MDI5973983.1 hypothetical protein [Streptantibioticus silvisoli]